MFGELKDINEVDVEFTCVHNCVVGFDTNDLADHQAVDTVTLGIPVDDAAIDPTFSIKKAIIEPHNVT